MFGWEFPPLISGGLGTACYGLIKSLSKRNVYVTLVLPRNPGSSETFLRIIPANLKLKKVSTLLAPYMTQAFYSKMYKSELKAGYGTNIFEEVHRYSEVAEKLAKKERFDIIHCHDWMTYPAGIRAKIASGKPLVVHVHATEFDRTGGNGVNPRVYEIEREGMNSADVVIAVSNFTKNKIVRHYGVPPEKVQVVHNGVEFSDSQQREESKLGSKVVLFLGRLTVQKGPDYFLQAAKKILELEPGIKFVIAGTGDMERFLIEKAAEMDIAHSVLFAGFLSGKDVERAYRLADLYVMPSVSEPFGITPLEAIKSNTPVLISKQSGVSEVVKHCLKVDFWDVNEIVNKSLAVLRHPELCDCMKENASKEVMGLGWDTPAEKCVGIYKSLGSVI